MIRILLFYTAPPTYTVNDTFTPTEGTPFRIDLGLDANPIPGTGMYEWFFNGQSLTLQQPGVITGVDFIDFGGSIGRDSSGNYTVSSFNDAGTGNASFVIDVLCKPCSIHITGLCGWAMIMCVYCWQFYFPNPFPSVKKNIQK